MATPPIDSLVDLINKKGLNIGNFVLTAAGADATASKPLYVDSASKLASGTIPFSFPLSEASTTSDVLDITGTAAADVLTQTLVGGASVTTATKAGFIRVKVTDSGDVMTDGYYYLEVFTLT